MGFRRSRGCRWRVPRSRACGAGLSGMRAPREEAVQNAGRARRGGQARPRSRWVGASSAKVGEKASRPPVPGWRPRRPHRAAHHDAAAARPGHTRPSGAPAHEGVAGDLSLSGTDAGADREGRGQGSRRHARATGIGIAAGPDDMSWVGTGASGLDGATRFRRGETGRQAKGGSRACRRSCHGGRACSW